MRMKEWNSKSAAFREEVVGKLQFARDSLLEAERQLNGVEGMLDCEIEMESLSCGCDGYDLETLSGAEEFLKAYGGLT